MMLASNANAQTKTVQQVGTRATAAVSQVPSILLPASSAGQSDLCLGVSSLAYGTTMVGLTLDFTHNDNNCATIRDAKEAEELGLKYTAIQLMCSIPKFKAAAKLAGEDCEKQHE